MGVRVRFTVWCLLFASGCDSVVDPEGPEAALTGTTSGPDSDTTGQDTSTSATTSLGTAPGSTSDAGWTSSDTAWTTSASTSAASSTWGSGSSSDTSTTSDTSATTDTGTTSEWPDDPLEPYEDGVLAWAAPLPAAFVANGLAVDPDGRIFVSGASVGPAMVEVSPSGSIVGVEHFTTLMGADALDDDDALRDLAAPTSGHLFGVASIYAFLYDTNSATFEWVVPAELPENYPFEVYVPPQLTQVEATPGGLVLVSGYWHDGFDYTSWVSQMDSVSGAKLWSLNDPYQYTPFVSADDALGPTVAWYEGSNPGKEFASMTFYEEGTGTIEQSVHLNAVFDHYVHPQDIVPTLDGDLFLPMLTYASGVPGWVTRLTPTGDIVWSEPLHPTLYPGRASAVGIAGDHYLSVSSFPDIEAVLRVLADGSTTTLVHGAFDTFVDLTRAPDDALLLLRVEDGTYRVERWVF